MPPTTHSSKPIVLSQRGGDIAHQSRKHRMKFVFVVFHMRGQPLVLYGAVAVLAVHHTERTFFHDVCRHPMVRHVRLTKGALHVMVDMHHVVFPLTLQQVGHAKGA